MGVPPRCYLEAGITEEAMNDFAHRLAGFEIVNERGVALGRRGLRHAPRGSIVEAQVAWERNVALRLLRHRVETAVAHGVTVGLVAARALDLGQLDVLRCSASE